MAQRGKCRCGAILQFRKTPLGYKTRCPQCKAVVRLRVDDPTQPGQPLSPTAVAAVAAPAPDYPSFPGVSGTDSPPSDFSVQQLPESTGPVAEVEMEVYHPPAPNPNSSVPWWLLVGVVLVVVALGTTLALLWSST
jgi:hypothetical protein